MSKYYYAVASLPMLFYDQPPVFSSRDFLKLCSEQLTAGDFAVLQTALLGDTEQTESDIQFLKEWKKWETSLRNELVKLRAAKRHQAPDEYLHQGESIIGMPDFAKEIVSLPNPYEAEKRLYSRRWEYLNFLETNKFFSLETLVAYYLKLQILEKLGSFNRKDGEAFFQETYMNIKNQDVSEPKQEETES